MTEAMKADRLFAENMAICSEVFEEFERFERVTEISDGLRQALREALPRKKRSEELADKARGR